MTRLSGKVDLNWNDSINVSVFCLLIFSGDEKRQTAGECCGCCWRLGEKWKDKTAWSNGKARVWGMKYACCVLLNAAEWIVAYVAVNGTRSEKWKKRHSAKGTKNVTNLQPERSSRRAITQAAVTPQMTEREWKPKWHQEWERNEREKNSADVSEGRASGSTL